VADHGEHAICWANHSGVARFYCERWTGLSIWAHALGRMIAFRGGYLNIQDPAEIAFVRTTDYFKRGMIVEQSNSQIVPTGPVATRSIPAAWPVPQTNPLCSTIRMPVPAPTPLPPSMMSKRPSPKHDRAATWLRTMLRDGRPFPAAWMTQQAQLARISPRTLRRARMAVGVIATKGGMTGGWAWMLPQASHGSLG
jgi:hypothetical protein